MKKPARNVPLSDQRMSYLRKQQELARRALPLYEMEVTELPDGGTRIKHRQIAAGQWWDGSAGKWRSMSSRPRNAKEAASYRDASDRLAEITEAIVGYMPKVTAFNNDPPADWDSAEREASERAAFKVMQSCNAKGKKDDRKDDAQYVWEVLVAKFGEDRLLRGRLDRSLIAEALDELQRGRITMEEEGVKSFIRRRRDQS